MNIEDIARSLSLANPWWENKAIPKRFQFSFERPQLKTIMSYEKLGRIIIIKGPRRTGKTTLMYQYIDRLIKQGIDPRSIVFASMDDINLRLPLQDLIDSYRSIINPLNKPKELYLFIDEIQFLDNWSSMAKTIIDRDSSVHLTVSGSSASLLIKSSESLAGRTIEETIFPFTMREVIQMESKEKPSPLGDFINRTPVQFLEKLKFNSKFILFKPALIKRCHQYLKYGGFPQLLKIKDRSLWLELLRTDIIQKAIYKDLAELYSIKNPLVLEKLFIYLIRSTAGILNLSSVSTQLKISRETLSQYIGYLRNSYFLFSLPKYSHYPKEILKSQEKIHIIDPSFALLAGKGDKDRLLESVIASLLLRQKNSKLYYWRKNYEVDCVLERGEMLLPIEVKNNNRDFNPSEYRGMINFMNRFKARTKLGLILYNGEAKEIKLGNFMIRMLPVWYVLANL